MRKYAILVLMMAFVVAAVSGCGLIVKDSEVDAQTVIIEVAGEKIVKADVQQAVENVLDYQQYIYSLYGYSFDRTDADTVSSAQDTAISGLIEDAVTSQKIKEYGLDQFTDAEIAAMTETADETYASYIDTIQSVYFAGTELTGEELAAAIETKRLEIGYSSREELLAQAQATQEAERLKALVVKDVAVTEDEITAQYNSGLSEQMTNYTSDLTQYATDVNNGEIIYFQPHDYRYVKNLLIKISDADKTQLSSLSSSLTDREDTLASIQEAVAALPEDPAADTQEQQQTRQELTAQVDTLTAEIADLNSQLDALTASAYGAIEPTVNMVEAKIEAGEDFDALIEAYGEDTGMTVEPQKSQGYLVCEGLTTYLDEFVTQAMALASVGDISSPFRTSYGVHILKYASDLDGGKVPLSSIHDKIAESLLSARQDTVYGEAVSQWVTDAKAKIYKNKLAD